MLQVIIVIIFLLGRHDYLNTDSVVIKFFGHNLKVSHLHHACYCWSI